MSLLQNLCPQCKKAPMMEYFIKLKTECEHCGYTFEAEPGAFTGALYLNLTLSGLSTFPFFCLLFIPGINIFSVATLTLLWILFTSPLTLRFSKIIWVKIIHKQKTR